MRRTGYKGRCEKRQTLKCEGVCRTYDPIQKAYVETLEQDEQVKSYRCNVPLDDGCADYMTDFVCTKQDGSLMVRECVQRKYLTKPMTVRLLDTSQEYWMRHGVTDWGLVIDAAQ